MAGKAPPWIERAPQPPLSTTHRTSAGDKAGALCHRLPHCGWRGLRKATPGCDFSCPVDPTLNRQVAPVETVRATLRISAPAAPSDPGGPRASTEANIGRLRFGRAEPTRFDSRAAVRVLRARAGDLRARETEYQPRRRSIVPPGMGDGAVLDRSDGCSLADQLGYVDSNKTAVCDITLAFYWAVTAADFIRSASPQTLRGRHCHRLGSAPRGGRASGPVP